MQRDAFELKIRAGTLKAIQRQTYIKDFKNSQNQPYMPGCIKPTVKYLLKHPLLGNILRHSVSCVLAIKSGSRQKCRLLHRRILSSVLFKEGPQIGVLLDCSCRVSPPRVTIELHCHLFPRAEIWKCVCVVLLIICMSVASFCSLSLCLTSHLSVKTLFSDGNVLLIWCPSMCYAGLEPVDCSGAAL